MKTFTTFAAALIIAAAASSVSGQEFPLIAKVSLQEQDFSKQKGNVITDKVRTLRLTTKDLLDFVAQAHGQTTFPFGARLVLVDYTHFQVQSANGTVLIANTAPFLTYTDTYSDGRFLYLGREDLVKGTQKYTYFYQFTIQFNDPANDVEFTFTGNALEKYSRSAADLLGHRVYKGSLAWNGMGSGMIGESFFLLSGRITSPAMTWLN